MLSSHPTEAMSGTRSTTEPAHAKINLLLRILAREASGYHSIETLFQRIELHDIVSVRVDDGDSRLICSGPAMPAEGLGDAESNLAWRAAESYSRIAGWPNTWQIELDKRIPVGGGLGGGSSDAAAVLRALDRLSPSPLGQARLLEIAGTLGSDVAFLTSNDSLALAWNRGDRFVALPALPTMNVVLLTFDSGVNTASAYRKFAMLSESAGVPVAPMRIDTNMIGSWGELADFSARSSLNDFEKVVPSMHEGVRAGLPALQELASHIRAEGLAAFAALSGSGATCFLLFPDKPFSTTVLEVETIASQLSQRLGISVRTLITRTLCQL